MLDSLELFEEISRNEFLENTEFILFLNKHDLFLEKLEKSNLSACLPDYDGKQELLNSQISLLLVSVQLAWYCQATG